MEMDTALNLVALVAPVGVTTFGIWAYLRVEDAMDQRGGRAAMGRTPFHPKQLPPDERVNAQNSSGQTPGIWFLERSVDVLLGRSQQPPTRLDYVREFHPEKLEKRGLRLKASKRR